MLFHLLAVMTIVSFYAYGASCVASKHMVAEFERYGLAQYRQLTGYLQLLGATGLLVGLLVTPWIGLLAAIGLSVQMLLGFGVRLRIKDPVFQCLPSFTYIWVNAGLALGYYNRL